MTGTSEGWPNPNIGGLAESEPVDHHGIDSDTARTKDIGVIVIAYVDHAVGLDPQALAGYLVYPRVRLYQADAGRGED